MLARQAAAGRILGAMPTSQSFANHAHRPTASLVAFVCTMMALAVFVRQIIRGDRSPMVIALLGVGVALLALVYISRVYVVRLQDRIIRLEMRVRGASLLTPDQQRLLAGLPIKTVVALRFASDAELPLLIERAGREQLTATDIKRAVTVWVPDYDRT